MNIETGKWESLDFPSPILGEQSVCFLHYRKVCFISAMDFIVMDLETFEMKSLTVKINK